MTKAAMFVIGVVGAMVVSLAVLVVWMLGDVAREIVMKVVEIVRCWL